jgi:hypothetical protein
MARSLSSLKKDLTTQITADLNTLVEIITEELPNYSPQWTGFFASSWKAGKSRANPTDEVENYQPWAQIKRDKTRAYFSAGRGAPGTAAARTIKPVIQPRFTAPLFKLTDSIFIGNTTKYARYALASSDNKIMNFVQGEIGPLVRSVFGDKKGPNLRIAAGFRGSAKSPTGSKYIEP